MVACLSDFPKQIYSGIRLRGQPFLYQKKWDTLGTFTQKVLFLDYNKTKRKKVGHFGVMDCNLNYPFFTDPTVFIYLSMLFQLYIRRVKDFVN